MRKRKSFERPEGVKSGRLVVIAAEGKETENIYFEQMKVSFHASGVQIEILRRDTNESSPEHVYRQIQDFAAKYDMDEDDQLWAVVDKDQWTEQMLSGVAQKCSQNERYFFCVSNPCFELWLILHLEDVAQYAEEDRKSLSENKKIKRNGDTWTKKRLRELMAAIANHNTTRKNFSPKLKRQSKEHAIWTLIPAIDGPSLWVPESIGLSTAS